MGVVGMGRVVVNRRWKGRGVGEEVALPGRQGKMERRANAKEQNKEKNEKMEA